MNDGGKRQSSCVICSTLRREFGRLRSSPILRQPTLLPFGSTVTFRRGDGRVQKYRIVGEDEADPNAGSFSFVSPVARPLMGNAVGDEVGASGQKLEIISIS